MVLTELMEMSSESDRELWSGEGLEQGSGVRERRGAGRPERQLGGSAR